MDKNIKKHIAALCALCMIMTALSGCSDNGGNVSDTSDTVVSDMSDVTEASDSTGEADSQAQTENVLSFSMPSGFYEEKITLEMTCTVPEGKIYYTLDGSEPTEKSQLYTKPLTLKNRSGEENVLSAAAGISKGNNYVPSQKVKKANVIRAAALLPDGTWSEIVNGTYFVGIDREEQYESLPVISILTDTANLFNNETGIYVLGQTYKEWSAEQTEHYEDWQAVGNYSNSGREWERPAAMEFLPADGSEGFSQNFGMRVMGAASRSAAQKSLRFIAREEYGKKNLKYELIPNNLRSDGQGEVEKYKSFALRNGGNDCDFAKIRDPFWQSLAENIRCETQQSTPCVVYIDGEYWGLYTITEDYSDNYFENNYGIDNKNVVLIKCGEVEDGEESDIELYNELYDFITGNDMSDTANYLKACEMIDMGSLWDYCALNLYIHNQDGIFENNNWRMWRVRQADDSCEVSDGRWRMVVYDIDYSSGIYDGGYAGTDNISKSLNGGGNEGGRPPADIIRSLCANTDFVNGLVNAMCNIRNINMKSDTATRRLSDMYDLYGKGAGKTFRRFGPDWIASQDTDNYFAQKILELSAFVEGRYNKFPDIMQKAFGLSPAANMTLSVSDSTKGSALINEARVSLEEDFNGKYFPECPITLTAVPENGARFVKWEYEGCEISDAAAENVTVTFTGDFSVKAVFE
ncbi:MAG: CotH kinase family protein [Huintestinicola sp.]